MDCRWNSPGQNTGVGSCFLLQGIFPTQESNPVLPHCRWIIYKLRDQGIPKNIYFCFIDYTKAFDCLDHNELWKILKEMVILDRLGFPGVSAGKECACNAGDLDSISGLGRSPGEWNSYPLQYSGLENSMDCIVHGVTKSRTRLSNFHFTSTVVSARSTLNLTFKITCHILEGLE